MFKLKSMIAAVAFLIAGSQVSAADVSAGSLHLSSLYTRAMIPGAEVGAGYLTITNTGDVDDRLIGANASRAKLVQIHEMKMENDVMIMRELPNGLTIPAGGSIELKPGGYHVMFLKVSDAFREGQVIKATLRFEKAGDVTVDFPVASAAATSPAAADDLPQSAESETDPQKNIPAAMKAMFETTDKPLTVRPVVVQGNWAVAGWVQDGRGGRALLKNSNESWAIYLCSGDSLKNPVTLEKVGLTNDDAIALTQQLQTAESGLDGETLKLFASFEGTVTMNTGPDVQGGSHVNHAK